MSAMCCKGFGLAGQCCLDGMPLGTEGKQITSCELLAGQALSKAGPTALRVRPVYIST